MGSHSSVPYEITIEPQGAYVRLVGACSYEDVLRATMEVWEHPNFSSMHYEIFDYLGVTSIDFSDYEVVELAVRDSVASKMSRRSKMAIVAKHPEILALSQDYQESLKDPGMEFRVHASLEEARRWVTPE